MADYLSPEDVSPADAQTVLDRLNAFQTPEEIDEAVEFPREKDVGILVAERLLKRRAELGKFTSLEQVREVDQVGPKRFTDIVKALSKPAPAQDPGLEDKAPSKPAPAQPPSTSMEDVVEALSRCEEDFMGRSGVVAVAVGFRAVEGQETDEVCVKAFVTKKLPLSDLEEDQVLPRQVLAHGNVRVTVDVEEMEPPWAGGGFVQRAAANAVGLRNRVRPVLGGFSVAHFRVTAGTIGSVVRDRQQQGVFYILSNNHVLADSNAGCLGDAILQPGPADGGRAPQDMIARLCRCIIIEFGGASNLVDAAIAQVRFCDAERRIYWIGEPKAVRRQSGVLLGENLQKSGRTTGYTQGRIIGLHGTVNVNYGGGRVARFREQIFATEMSAGGDSGSLVLDLEGNALGLLFAGSSTNTILTPIEEVQNQLGIVVADKMV